MSTVYTKLNKSKKPRVQISYEVEDGGKSEKKELPFVVGVLGDFSAQSTIPQKPFKQRKFINIDGNNFNTVMSNISPGLSIKVKNTLHGNESEDNEFNVQLNFKSMNDFLPDLVAQQVEPLKKLLDVRAKLKEILSKADRSEELENMLENLLTNNEQLKALSQSLGISNDDGSENKSV